MEDSVIIYGLADPISGEIRYMDRSASPRTRLRAHCQEARTGRRTLPVHQWINTLKKKPRLIELDTCYKSQGPDLERRWISKTPGVLNVIGHSY